MYLVKRPPVVSGSAAMTGHSVFGVSRMFCTRPIRLLMVNSSPRKQHYTQWLFCSAKCGYK